jgi:hypothetical protein
MVKDPIFIVGVPRSGTTLLAALLAAHSKMSCGPETHFFRKLPKSNLDYLFNAATWPIPAIDFICSVTHNSFSENKQISLIDKYQLNKQVIVDYLVNQDPSIHSILSSVTESYMRSLGKSRWVEKTPDHIEYVHLIRKYFPKSPIIRILRDPRDTALSLMRMSWGAMSIHEALSYWVRLDDSSKDFFRTDPLSFTIRYEDLILSTKDELQKLCNFIGEEFEEGMLDTSRTGKQLNSRNVPWKEMASKPIDSGKVSMWKREMTEPSNILAEAILGDRLKDYQYPVSENFERFGVVYPSSKFFDKHGIEFQFLATQGIRFWKTHSDEKPSARIYVGDPANSDWTDGVVLVKLHKTISLVIEVIRSLAKKDKVYWISENCETHWTGFKAYLLKMLLTPYKI